MDPNDGRKRRSSLGDITEDDSNNDDDENKVKRNSHSHKEGTNNGIAPEKVLSMKKTAEIAAMFTELKLDQTTNVVGGELTSGEYTSGPQTEDSAASLDFETSLGYLPWFRGDNVMS